MSRSSAFQTLFLSMSVLGLAACGASHGVEPNKTAAPVPPVAGQGVAANAGVPMPTIDETTDPVLVPMNAVPLTALNTDDRLARLEQAVASLRADYDTILPAFSQLNITNTRVQALLDQMDAERQGLPAPTPKAATTVTTVTTTEKTAVPVAPAPPTGEAVTASEVVTTQTTTLAATPVAPETANVIKAIRLGEHPGKTRLVIDFASTGAVTPAYDLDNAEKLLLIDLPGVAVTEQSQIPQASGIISALSANETATGSNLAIQLKGNAKILLKEYLKAQGKDSARLVVDIGAAD